MPEDGIDRDLAGNPPASLTDVEYARLLDAFVKQSLAHFTRALPRPGLLSLFKKTPELDSAVLGKRFEAAYRKLLTETTIALPEGDSLQGDPQAKAFVPLPVFITETRSLIVPEAFVESECRSPADKAASDEEVVAACFSHELIGTMDRVLTGAKLPIERRKKICETACFDIAMDFDDNLLDERLDGQAVAAILCYRTASGRLVLSASTAAQHDYVHGNLDEYFDRQSSDG